MLSTKLRLGLFVMAAASCLVAPVTAFAGDEGTVQPWTQGTQLPWEYNPNTQQHPTNTGPKLGEIQPVDTTLEIAKPQIKLDTIKPCVILKTC